MTKHVSRRQVLQGAAGGAAAVALPQLDLGRAPDRASAGAGGAGGLELHTRRRTDGQWARLLADQDLVWKRLPRAWYEGPFLGNGFLGSMIYAEAGANALRFTVQHSQ